MREETLFFFLLSLPPHGKVSAMHHTSLFFFFFFFLRSATLRSLSWLNQQSEKDGPFFLLFMGMLCAALTPQLGAHRTFISSSFPTPFSVPPRGLFLDQR